MIDKVLTAIFGSKHERDVKRMLPIVQQINDFEPTISKLSDGQLRAKTDEFRQRLRPVVERLENAKREVPRDEALLESYSQPRTEGHYQNNVGLPTYIICGPMDSGDRRRELCRSLV